MPMLPNLSAAHVLKRRAMTKAEQAARAKQPPPPPPVRKIRIAKPR
ncbi:MAG: hypothetical protein KGJ78_04660 [Alphaproteobacteria bacterium]|nr:hypothetical protein [Alphaproteobacteria bacterium]